MSIKLNGATSGSVELDVPDAIGSDLNITIPGAAGTLDRLERAGNILKIDHASSSVAAVTTSTSYADNVTIAFSPVQSNSRLLILCKGNFNTNDASSTNDRVKIRLLQNNNGVDTVLWESLEALVSYTAATEIHVQGIGSDFFTSGGDTWGNTVTLKFQWASNLGGSVQKNNNGRSTITVIEVAA